MDFLRASWLLFQCELGGALRAKRTLIAALLALGPIMLAMFVTQVAMHEGPPPSVEIGYVVAQQVLVPLLSLVIGSGVVANEVADRTITYPFTRPMPRPALLIGRWMASVVILLAILLPSVFGMVWVLQSGFPGGVGGEIPAGVILPLVKGVVLGTLVYSAVFAALGTIVKYPMIVGLGYGFVFEVLLANLPGKSQGLAIQYHLRCFVIDGGSEAWRNVAQIGESVIESGDEALSTLLWTLFLALALGSFFVSRRQYVLPS